jgi:hypothetical protein
MHNSKSSHAQNLTRVQPLTLRHAHNIAWVRHSTFGRQRVWQVCVCARGFLPSGERFKITMMLRAEAIRTWTTKAMMIATLLGVVVVTILISSKGLPEHNDSLVRVSQRKWQVKSIPSCHVIALTHILLDSLSLSLIDFKPPPTREPSSSSAPVLEKTTGHAEY